MELAECYQLLEVHPNATIEDIKASYRRLARRYHPDVNPNNREQAHTKFIQITEAYKYLLEKVSTQQTSSSSSQSSRKQSHHSNHTTVNHAKTDSYHPGYSYSKREQTLKWDTYQELQTLLKQQRLVRATSLVESLAERFPNDSEVRQWQAITYQQRGRQLVNEGRFDLARTFLKKALSTDPQNRSLWYEVDRDFQRIDPLL